MKLPYMLVRWKNGPPECVPGRNVDEVRRRADRDARTRKGIPYVIVDEEWEKRKRGTA